MSKEYAGPPAFPVPERPTEFGMSLRDYFAAAALTGILASGASCKPESWTCAEAAYDYADDMLKARKK